MYKLKTKTLTQVFESHEYEKFKFIRGNRAVDRKHVMKIKKSMQEKYFLDPIKVNSRLEILDGQHRFTAARELQLPIRYFVAASLHLEDVPKMNSLTDAWDVKDRLHSFKEQGIKDYERFAAFMDLFPRLPYTTAMMLLSGEDTRKKKIEMDFEAGTFRIKDWAGAVKKAEFLMKVALIYKGTFRRTFTMSLLRVMNNPDFLEERFLRKLEKKHLILKDYSKEKDFIQVLEEMYNWMESKKVRFF